MIWQLLGGLGEAVAGPADPYDVNRFAVVVGINDYAGTTRDLQGAVEDAKLMRRALVNRLGFPNQNVILLTNGQASRGYILGSLDWLVEHSRAGGTVAFFYAGHTHRAYGDPDHDGEDVDEAMTTADEQVIYDGEIASTLASVRGQVWLLIAACYGAGFADAMGPGRIGSWAASEDELAYESPSMGRSFFVEFLIRRAVLEQNRTAIEEMHSYANRKMEGTYANYRPIMDDRISGRTDFGDQSDSEVKSPSSGDDEEQDEESRPCYVVLRCRP